MQPYQLLTDDGINVLRRMWRAVEHDPVFLVTNGAEYLVETPDQRQDRGQDDSDEAVLRVFCDYEDAILYCEQQRENCAASDQEMLVARSNVKELFGLMEVIEANAAIDFQATVSVDLCCFHDGEPVVIDTLHSSLIAVH